MRSLPLIAFVTRHAVELQGLRTAVVGGFCLALAALQLRAQASGQEWPVISGAGWILLLLVAWHLDDRVVAYYRRRIGWVQPRQPLIRLASLISVAVIYVALRGLEVRVHSPVAISALFVAARQLHIGWISGHTYRRHYLVGASGWSVLALAPVLGLPAPALANGWFFALGLSLVCLGWRDHVLLMHTVSFPEESEYVAHV